MKSNNSEQKNSNQSDRYTVPSLPPVKGGSQRRSKWAALFDECRAQPGVWRRTVQPFTRSTAAQIASDIRNTSRRDPKKMRLRGLLPGERWEAVWGPSPDEGGPQQCFIWLRFLGSGAGADGGSSLVASGPVPVPEVEYAW